jgi:hypothetical protein
MRKKERKGPGIATSSEDEEEEEEAPGPEDCVPLDCSEGAAGAALQALQGPYKNAHKKNARRNADRQLRYFMAKSSIRP